MKVDHVTWHVQQNISVNDLLINCPTLQNWQEATKQNAQSGNGRRSPPDFHHLLGTVVLVESFLHFFYDGLSFAWRNDRRIDGQGEPHLFGLEVAVTVVEFHVICKWFDLNFIEKQQIKTELRVSVRVQTAIPSSMTMCDGTRSHGMTSTFCVPFMQ
jgi:hypothetical protein